MSGVLGVVLALPASDTLRGQLLSLIGILLSAAIALSAKTFIGNIMAGMEASSFEQAALDAKKSAVEAQIAAAQAHQLAEKSGN